MARDAVTEQAKIQIVRASVEIEAQVSSRAGFTPILWLIKEAQDDAAQALTAVYTAALTEQNPRTEDDRRKLWLRIAVYDEIIRLVRKVVDDGYRFEREMTDDDRQNIADLISPASEGQEMQSEPEIEGIPADARGGDMAWLIRNEETKSANES